MDITVDLFLWLPDGKRCGCVRPEKGENRRPGPVAKVVPEAMVSVCVNVRLVVMMMMMKMKVMAVGPMALALIWKRGGGARGGGDVVVGGVIESGIWSLWARVQIWRRCKAIRTG